MGAFLSLNKVNNNLKYRISLYSLKQCNLIKCEECLKSHYLTCLQFLNFMKRMIGDRLASFKRLQMDGETPYNMQ